MIKQTHFTIRYKTFEGTLLELCVEGGNVTEAIEVARHEVPSLMLHPGRICSVIGGCK